MNEAAHVASNDNIRRPIRFLLFFGIPLAGLAGANFLVGMPLLREIVYISSFAWMGVACLINAFACNRVHCWFTGPWCLLVAIALAYRLTDLRAPGISFGLIVNAGFVVFVLLWFIPELVLGRYFRRRREA